ncbi:MAG: hypothetical protein HN919_20630 [Verrucomicrobia bacterium]|jgi:Tfp pilus assembly PilM family ATPase|nr:hypothetical protein [Verrucomicrobiota bacterium]MBT7068712.1 hypothetical protein [Verrucomicrobiota bacterium]MBT7700998.1 hypothetical protein [Verrucomicrobiota bacterium]
MIHRETVGLDLGSHSAKVVRAMRVGGRLMVRDADWVHLPPDMEERRRLLAAFLADKGYTDVPIVLGIPGKAMMLNVVEVSVGDPRTVADVVTTEQERVEGLTEQDTAADHVVFRSAGHRYILLAMARADAVGRAASVLSALHEEDVGDIVPGSMALYRTVCELGRRTASGSTLCLDIGHEGTEVVVGRGSKVLFSRCLSGAPARTSEPASEPALPGEVAACLESFHAAFPSPAFTVKRIVLSGGGSLAAGVAVAIESATGVTTVMLSHWVRKAPMEEIERYGRAIGLAACGVRRGGAGISLLPRALRESRILRWQKPYWLLCGAALVGLMLLVLLGTLAELRWDREYLRLRQVELAGLHALDRKLAVTEQLNEALEERIAPFRTAVHNADVLRIALQSIAAAKHPDDWLSLLADAAAYSGVVLPAEAPLDAEAPDRMARREGFRHVIVEGYTPVDDFSTVGRMIELLHEQDGVVAADLLGDDRLRDDPARDARWADTGCSLFVIEMTVEVP